jgi:adenylate cyclase
VKHKLALAFEPLGKQRVKNITEPIGVYRLAGDATARKRSILARIMQPGMLRARLAPATILLLVAGAGAASWYFNSHHPEPIHRLSIVVLPFTNLSNDPEQEYFADAISNDLTTDLSRIADSFVIAPNTARAYKGRNLDARQIGRELNVRYILEGSLRRTENQVRINAQLIDTETEAAIWSDRFDGDWTRSCNCRTKLQVA